MLVNVIVLVVAFGVWGGRLLGESFSRVALRDTPRVARTRALRVDDFVPPELRLGLAVAAVGGIGLFEWSWSRGDATAADALFWLTPAVVLALCELGTALALRLPEPATTRGELFLQDALRDQTTRESYVASSAMMAACYASPLYVDGEWVMALPLGLALVAAVALTLWREQGRPRGDYSRMRRRLWPQFSPDDVVSSDTGEPVAPW